MRIPILEITVCLLLLSCSIKAENTNEYDDEIETSETEEDGHENLPPSIVNVRIKQYDKEGIVDSLLGAEESILHEFLETDSFQYNREAVSFTYNGSFQFARSGCEPYVAQIQLTPCRYWMQDNYLDAIFPNDPQEMPCFEEAFDTVSAFAADIGFSASNIRSYKIDHSQAKNIWDFFQRPAPGKSKLDECPYEWEESEDGIYFVLEPDTISGFPYSSLAEDGLLKIIWTQEYGMIYVDAPYLYEVVSAKEVDIVDCETARKGIRERASIIYILQCDLLEIDGAELVYTYKPFSMDIPAETAILVPCWKFNYHSNDPDQNVFRQIPILEKLIKKISDRDGYILIDAVSGDPADLDINVPFD